MGHTNNICIKIVQIVYVSHSYSSFDQHIVHTFLFLSAQFTGLGSHKVFPAMGIGEKNVMDFLHIGIIILLLSSLFTCHIELTK